MGLKRSSDTVAISFRVQEPAAATFTQNEINLTLDILNNEVFVVQAIDLDCQAPDAVAGLDTRTSGSLTTTSQGSVRSLADSNCLAAQILEIAAAGFADGGVGFTRSSVDSVANMDHLGIIATDNFFIQVEGVGNIGGRTMTGKLYGYRAKADASTYAALVQSEVLSS